MANFIYKKAKQSIMNGEINFSSNLFKVLIIDKTHYTPNQDADQYVSDIPQNAIKKRSSQLENVTNSLGIIDAQNLSIPDYDGSAFNAIVFYVAGNSDSNSKLIFFIDTSEGLPFNGSNTNTPLTFLWSNSNEKIISI